MSMRDINNTRLSICEVLRCVNDRLQGPEHVDIRDMLALAEQMAKRMIKKLVEYNRAHERDWWEKNPQYIGKINRELAPYLSGNAERARVLLQSGGNKCGIVCIAFGEDYDNVAAQTLAMSRKYIYCPITVLTNVKKRSPLWKGVRNISFVELDIPTDENRRVKIELYKYSPYDETIYIDCDAVIKKPGIEKLFDKLSGVDIVFQRHRVWTEDKKYFRIYRDTAKLLGATLPLVVLVGGFWAFRKGETIEKLSRQWLENWEKTGCGRDMPALACAIQKTGIMYSTISRDDGFFSLNINDKAIAVHRKRNSDMIRLGIRGYKPNKPFDNNFQKDWQLVYFNDGNDAIMSHSWVLKNYENKRREEHIQNYVNRYLPEISNGNLNVLDIAAGPGEVMEAANHAGCASLGIEIDAPTKDKENERVRIEYIKLKHAQKKLDIIYDDFNNILENGHARINGNKYDIINCKDAINTIAGVDGPLSLCSKKPEDRLFEIKRDNFGLYHNDGAWRFGEKYNAFFNRFFLWCKNHINTGGVLVVSAQLAKNYRENSDNMIRIANNSRFKLDKCVNHLCHRFIAA